MSRSSPPQFSLWQARLYSLRSCVFCPLRLLHAKKNVRCARWRVRDRKVTLWGRTPSCRLRCLWLRRELKTSCAGRSEFPPYSFKMRIADLIWRKMCRGGGDPSNRQTGGLPHRVTFLSHTQYQGGFSRSGKPPKCFGIPYPTVVPVFHPTRHHVALWLHFVL